VSADPSVGLIRIAMHLAWELVDYIEHAVLPPIVGLAKRAPVMTSWKPDPI
jgi:cytochrome c oxidase subunit IV